MSLHTEIYEQPAVLQRWLQTQLPRAQEIANAIRQRQIEFVYLAARGSSDHAGVYAQYIWGALNQLPVAFAAPSLFTRYHAKPSLRKALVLGISQSGQSPDVVSVIEDGRAQGALTVAITNAPGSPLATTAEFHLDVAAGEEKAVAATKSYTAQLLGVAALAACLSPNAAHTQDLWRVPESIQHALHTEPQAQALAQAFAHINRCVVLGRGFHYTSAMEWSLKLKELAYVFADPYSSADFLHGPVAIVEQGFPVLAFAPSGAVLADVCATLQQLRERGATVLVIGDNDDALQLGQHTLALRNTLPEWLKPLANIVPAQLFAYHLTQAKGYNPETPRGLNKVTLTE